MPSGIPAPELGVLIFEADIRLSSSYHLGQTQYGDREVNVVETGSITGERISASILSGSLDLQLELASGVIEIEQIFNLKSPAGDNIYLRTAGVGVSKDDVRIVFHFEAPNSGEYSWLNEGVYLGRRRMDDEKKALHLSVYRVQESLSKIREANLIQIEKPESVPSQSWEYRRAETGETRGDEIISENVTLGPSLMVGPSKDGRRNTIPITGGTVVGRIDGKVLSAGGDYQQLSPPPVIDARYLWQTSEGDVIIVRNAGTFGSLVPTFEANAGGKYAWLNDGRFLSTNPSMGAAGVSLKFYKSKM